MLTWPWWTYSILAAVLWGVHFNLLVKVSSVLPRDIYTPLTMFFITSLSMVFVVPFTHVKIIENINTLVQAEPHIRISAILLIFTALLGVSLLYIAMQLSGNATLASLLDITYPIFVTLVAWLVFREIQVDWSIVTGGALILAGSALIIWKHG